MITREVAKVDGIKPFLSQASSYMLSLLIKTLKCDCGTLLGHSVRFSKFLPAELTPGYYKISNIKKLNNFDA